MGPFCFLFLVSDVLSSSVTSYVAGCSPVIVKMSKYIYWFLFSIDRAQKEVVWDLKRWSTNITQDVHLPFSDNYIANHHSLFVVRHIEQCSRRTNDARWKCLRHLFPLRVFEQVLSSPSFPHPLPLLNSHLMWVFGFSDLPPPSMTSYQHFPDSSSTCWFGSWRVEGIS